MFEYIALAISIVTSNFPDYVNTSGKFTRKSKWRFEDYINYILFNNHKSIDVKLGNYFEKAINLTEITKQSISKQKNIY